MLVLNRKPGEEVVIGETMRLKLVSCPHNSARLELAAPGVSPIPIFQGVGDRNQILPGVWLKVVDSTRHGARLGIDAPDNVTINRAEVHERIVMPNGENK